jgi:hypothetical protein
MTNIKTIKTSEYLPLKIKARTYIPFSIKLEDYTKYFRDVRGYHIMNNMILSHIPVHSDSKGRFAANIHGHLHSNRVRKPRGVDAKTGEILYSNDIDPWYFNVSVEQTFFKPILFEDVLEKIKKQNQPSYSYGGFGELRGGLYADFKMKNLFIGIGTHDVFGAVSKNGLGQSILGRVTWQIK